MPNEFGFGGEEHTVVPVAPQTPVQQGGNTFGFGGPQYTNVQSMGSFGGLYQSTGGGLSSRDLITDPNFVSASKVLYQMNNGVRAVGLNNDLEYGEYGIEMMGWFNYNLPKMTLDASRIKNATDEQQRAFLYLMEAYDDLGMSWGGASRFFKGVVTDPTTYVGIGTFGAGAIVGKGAGIATKEGLKSLLRQSVRGGVIAGVEAGIYTAVDDINRQVIETSVSGEAIDLTRTARAGATGVALGFGLGAGVTAVAKRAQVRRAANQEKLAEASRVPDPELTTILDDAVEELPELLPAARATPQSPVGSLSQQVDTLVKEMKRVLPSGKVASLRPDGTQDLDALVEVARPLRELVIEATKAEGRTPADIATFILKHERTEFESNLLQTVTNQTVSTLKIKELELLRQHKKLSGKAAQAIKEEMEKLEDVIEPIQLIDSALATITAQTLVARKKGINVGELRTMLVKSLQEQGLSQPDAMKKMQDQIEQNLQNKANARIIAQMDKGIEKALADRDFSKHIQLKHEKKLKVDEIAEEALRVENGPGAKIYRSFNKAARVLNEVVISFVFSPATLIINSVPSLIKTIYKPFLNNLMKDGLSQASLRTMASEYTAMMSVTGGALRAAKAAWGYERSMLTGDSARFLEEYNIIPRKFGGGWLRVFPRALLATDAFFETLHYRGYTVGNATATAIEDGVQQGLKGKQLDTFVQGKVKEALDAAYEPVENASDILMNTGISKGLKGKELENFIAKGLKDDPEVFQQATDQEGRDYVQDVLFKRDFTGKQGLSAAAKWYEGQVNRHPVIRMMGQLFFRTPVRVFEEGVRLTPGLNLILPKFRQDLAGDNGPIRQARAQGEALLSYAFAGSVFALYSTGNITGSLGTNYRQRRQAEDTGQLEPYSIRLSDGSTFNYRNFDPFATPIKILVNALERAETLAYRTEQGERVNLTAEQELQGLVSVAVGSVAQSIRDANLTSGIDAGLTLFEDLQDPEGSGDLIKFLGQKVQTFLPNTFYKVQMLDNPVLSDPVKLEQFVRYRINPSDPLVPKQYTALGRPRTLSNPMANLIYFDTSTEEEKKRGVPEKELEVEQFLYQLAQVNNSTFTAPYTYSAIPNLDLRTKLTSDGQETYYDRWMRYTHESGIVDALHTLRGLPLGSASTNGIAATEARKIINTFRREAFMRLMSEERTLQAEYVRNEIIEAETRAGMYDVSNIPFTIGNN